MKFRFCIWAQNIIRAYMICVFCVCVRATSQRYTTCRTHECHVGDRRLIFSEDLAGVCFAGVFKCIIQLSSYGKR